MLQTKETAIVIRKMKKHLVTLPIMSLFWLFADAQTIIEPNITSNTSFAIIVDQATYNGAKDEIMAYKKSVEEDGLATFVVHHTWKDPGQIKKVLKNLYANEKSPLEGAVFVGDIPVPMLRGAQYLTSTFKMPERMDWHRSSVPSDRYYDDFDLEFKFIAQDDDASRKHLFYYELKPESPHYIEMDIYSGRIKPPNSNTENRDQNIAMIKNYLAKLVRIKKEKNLLDHAVFSTGHGYNSNSTTGWGGELLALRTSFQNLFVQGRSIKFLNYKNTGFLKNQLITELQRHNLDLAFMTGHGTTDLQLLNGYPDVSSPQPSMKNVGRYIRSKMRAAKKRGRDLEESKKRYQESLGLNDKWFDDAFSEDRMVEDSLFNINMDINSNDLKNINARVVYVNSCFTGAFQLSDYLAGHYPFSKGDNVVAFANSVGVLQDLWGLEFLGVLQHGARTGHLLKETAYLETHILGDPTFHFYADNHEQINSLFATKDQKKEAWLNLLDSGDTDLQAYALKRLFHLENEKEFSEKLLQILKTNPHEAVRTEAYFLLRRYGNSTYFEALDLSMQDNYEYLRRKSVFDVIELGNDTLIEKAVDLYLNSLESKRVIYKLEWAFRLFNHEKLLEVLDRKIKDNPNIYNAAELYTRLKEKVQYEKKKTQELLLSYRDTGLSDKALEREIRTLRAYRYHQLVPAVIDIVKDKEKSEEIRVSALEALSWFGLSFQQQNIKNLCQDLIDNEKNKSVRVQALKTLNIINDARKRPF